MSEDVEGELGVKAVSTLPPLTQNASPNVKLIPPTGLEASPLSPFDILLAWKRPPSLVNVILFTVSYQLASTGVDVDNETRFCNRLALCFLFVHVVKYYIFNGLEFWFYFLIHFMTDSDCS